MPWHWAGLEHQHLSWLSQCGMLNTTIWPGERVHCPSIFYLIELPAIVEDAKRIRELVQEEEHGHAKRL